MNLYHTSLLLPLSFAGLPRENEFRGLIRSRSEDKGPFRTVILGNEKIIKFDHNWADWKRIFYNLNSFYYSLFKNEKCFSSFS